MPPGPAPSTNVAAVRVPRARRRLLGPLLALVLAGCAQRDEAWYATGIKRHEGGRRGGEPHGDWSYWYPDGAIREEGQYRDGVRTGVWTQWHPNGQRYSTGERRLDPDTGAAVRVGPWVFWHPNGQRYASGDFDGEGRRTGKWVFFSSRGEPVPTMTGTYREGVLQR